MMQNLISLQELRELKSGLMMANAIVTLQRCHCVVVGLNSDADALYIVPVFFVMVRTVLS